MDDLYQSRSSTALRADPLAFSYLTTASISRYDCSTGIRLGLTGERGSLMASQNVDQPIPEQGKKLPSPRKVAAILFATGLALIGLNVATTYIDRYYPALLTAAPALILVGAAGFVEPRICRGLFETLEGPPAPNWAKVIGWILLLAGLAVGGYVSFFVLA